MKHQVLFVDGYNMIGSWPQLEKLKKQERLEEARDLLLFELSNYAKYKGMEVIVVFDAQLVPGIQKKYEYYGLEVVFTKEEETADTYIEREVSNRLNRMTQVRVATSDLAEQWLVFSKGALRVSARELYQSLNEAKRLIEKDASDYHFQNTKRNSPWSSNQLHDLKHYLNNLLNQ